MNLPNKLSILRMCLVPVFVVIMVLTVLYPAFDVVGSILGVTVFLAASFTDLLDGKIARKYGLITDFGKFIDPLADKFMVIGMLVVMCASDMYASVRAVLVWVTLIVILRELAITSLRLLVASSEQKIVVAASWLGKVKTVSQIVAILVMILEPIIWSGNIASWITVCFMGVMTLWSGIDYLKSYAGFIDPNE